MTILQIRVDFNQSTKDLPTEGGIAIDKLLREDSSKEEQMIIEQIYQVCKGMVKLFADAVKETGGSHEMKTIGDDDDSDN